ncbi:fasciclin-1 [Dendroctonus ponderosae]|uniref:fasciclin-1 n=1 Tax=Dendroctonus ponderosae TaxID=77166 RepID=UPI0020361778|nr:fasciclin-1 [Dendroctonus ponderosae]
MKRARMNLFGLLRFCFFLILCFEGRQCDDESLEAKMRLDPDISQFYSLIEGCQICNFTLMYEPLTVFAPINAAFQKLVGVPEDPDSLAQYHLTNIPKRIEQLGVSYTSINTRLPGGPPIWITISPGLYHDAVYINNARLLPKQSNIIGTKSQSRGSPFTQILHKIDEVLVPTRSSATSRAQVFNPNAWEFLENYESLIQGTHRVRNFRQKVQQYKRESIFRTEGGHTFFIPVDEGFANNRAGLIDDYIIDGHVIPREVLFTTPTKKDSPFPTLANSDNVIRVIISFTQEQRDKTIINYVKSHTLFGDGKHPQGVVLAEIVKANIPVKNGVIHLIHKPLMIVDSTIKELLQENMDYICNVGNVQRMENIWDETPKMISRFSRPNAYYPYDPRIRFDDEKDGGILNNFLNELNDLGPEGHSFLRTIERSQDVTLFAPCNSALDNEIVRSIKRDKQKYLEVLQMHVVVDNRLYVDTVIKENQHKVYQVPTLIKGKNLYFNVVTIGNNRTMTVEGGGVNATVIQPDLAAKNGIIHIIDRVLGVPYSTILEKVSTDPMLRKSYELGQAQQFNAQLNATNKKFTYFIPSNKAWQTARVMMPSAIKKLFMEDFSYHAFTTLQRHLVISDDVFTMERIKQLTKAKELNQTNRANLHEPLPISLPTLRGSLEIFVEERKDNSLQRNFGSAYVIHWEELRIPVFRPNVECTNGIIHVIDMPFLKKGDIVVSSSSLNTASLIGAALAVLFARLLAE